MSRNEELTILQGINKKVFSMCKCIKVLKVKQQIMIFTRLENLNDRLRE